MVIRFAIVHRTLVGVLIVAFSGEKNTAFGIYKSVCCGAEVVIDAGEVFPGCPKHPSLTTIWKLTTEKKAVIHVATQSEVRPAAEMHIANHRLFDVAAGRCKLEPAEKEHLHQCNVCPGVLYVFLINQPISDGPEKTKKPEDAA
jgi:hypothetical protein